MHHVYEGNPDGRQSAERIAVSRFRPKYRALNDDEKALHDAIKAKAAELEALFGQVRDIRLPVIEIPAIADGGQHETILGESLDNPVRGYLDDGMKSLELAVMWTVKGLTS